MTLVARQTAITTDRRENGSMTLEVKNNAVDIADGKACYLSGYSGSGLDKHHIFFGANRKISEDNGFWVWLRHDLHIAGSSYATPHNSRNIDLY